MRRSLTEALVVAVLGVLIGLVGNALSPKGLSLTRDYFPKAAPTPPGVSGLKGAAIKVQEPPRPGPKSAIGLSERLAKDGLQLLTHDEVVQRFRDPRYAQGLILFLDARNHKAYQAGHIPGAYEFDHYHLDDYVQKVLPLCQVADEIVVYCHGGECEDSQFAALDLIHLGIPSKRVFIYGGGITEWKSRSMPIETGDRGSGAIENPNEQ